MGWFFICSVPVYIVLGMLCFKITKWKMLKYNIRRRICSMQIEAEIMEVRKHFYDKNGNLDMKRSYYPIFCYHVDNEEYITEGYVGKKKGVYQPGMSRRIYCSPTNPFRIFQPESIPTNAVAYMVLTFGYFLVGIGFPLFFISLFLF